MKTNPEVIIDPEGMSVRCEKCKKVEKALPSENKRVFLKSLNFAGWKFSKSGHGWACHNCS